MDSPWKTAHHQWPLLLWTGTGITSSYKKGDFNVIRTKGDRRKQPKESYELNTKSLCFKVKDPRLNKRVQFLRLHLFQTIRRLSGPLNTKQKFLRVGWVFPSAKPPSAGSRSFDESSAAKTDILRAWSSNCKVLLVISPTWILREISFYFLYFK